MRRALLLLGSLAAALLLTELGVRVFIPQSLAWNTSAVWEPNDGLGWRRRPNLNVQVNTGERAVRVLSDERGHRVGAVRPAHADASILAIGDSFVEALQVDADQTMTALLAGGLSQAAGRTVQVVNAGVGGWDANQYLIAAGRELEAARYDLVLVFVFLENDLVARRVDRVPAAAVVPSSATTFLMRHSHLYVYARNLRDLRRMRTAARGRHLLSSIMRSEVDSPDWAATGEVLAEIAALASARRTPALFVLVPPEHYLDERALATYARAMGMDVSQLDVSQPARLLAARLASKGLMVYDATPALRRAFGAGRRDLYGRVDRHFAPAGHRVMADALQPVVLPYLVAGRHDQ